MFRAFVSAEATAENAKQSVKNYVVVGAQHRFANFGARCAFD